MPYRNLSDIESIRREFPILNREINQCPLVYLDNAASAQKPKAVLDCMRSQASHAYANVHRGLHTVANETTEAFEGARDKVAAYINARSSNEIIFTKSATEAINLVASGVSAEIEHGDEIILTVMEHHSNIVPWHFLRERYGAIIKWLDINPDGSLDIEQLATTITSKTKIVAISHMSNVLGITPDVKKIVDLVRSCDARILLDGCQAIVHQSIDVQELDCDYYVFSGHKLYGPTGVGILYGKEANLNALRPYQGGGEMIEIVEKDRITYGDLPHKFEAGTPPILEAIGLGAAIDWIAQFDMNEIAEYELSLYKKAVAALKPINGLRIHGDTERKGGVLSFSIEGIHPHDLAQLLDRHGVAIRAGHHCAQPLMQFLGVTATTRASFALYNTEQEVDTFVESLEKARAMLV